MTDLRTFSAPARKQEKRFLRAGDPERELLTLVGAWSAADVWLSAPFAGGSPWPRAELRLYGSQYNSRVLLQAMQPRDVPGFQQGTGKGQLVLSIRSRICDQFWVTAVPPPAGELVLRAEGSVSLEVWGSDQPVPTSRHDRIEMAMSLPTSASSAASGLSDEFTPLAGPGVLWRASVAIAPVTVPTFFQIYDSAGPLTGGDTPLDPGVFIPVGPAGSAVIVPPRGLRFRTGLTLAVSTSATNFVSPGAVAVFSADYDSLA